MWGPESYRNHGEQLWCWWYLHPLVRLGWYEVEAFSPSSASPYNEEQYWMSSSSTVVEITWGMSQASTTLQQLRRICTTSTCSISNWRSSSLASPRDAGGRLVPHHSHIRFDTPGLFLHDGVHFTTWGNYIFLNCFAESIKAQLQQRWNVHVWHFVRCWSWSWVLIDFFFPKHSPQSHVLCDVLFLLI